MKLIQPKVKQITPQPYDNAENAMSEIYKFVELCGRVCYKSEDKITQDSATGFVDRLIKSGHTSVLEHGTVYLELPLDEVYHGIVLFFKYNPYSMHKFVDNVMYVTTNLRVIVDAKDDTFLQYIVPQSENHPKRTSFRITCDKAVTHELVRHRIFSFSQESQRYCNYSKDKFNNEITFIKPYWYEDTEYNTTLNGTNFVCLLHDAEETYFKLLKNGMTPQQARSVLPNCTKTEIIMTGFDEDWKDFIELRTSKAAHPDMQIIANEIKTIIEK